MKAKLSTLIFFIFMLCIFCKINTKADVENHYLAPIIVQKGSASFKDFDEDEASSYFGYVDSDICGLNELYYNIGSEIVKRDVIVESEENIKKGIATTNALYTIYKDSENSIDGNIYFASNNSHFSYINQEEGDDISSIVYFKSENGETSSKFYGIHIVDMLILNDYAYVLYKYYSGYSKIGVMILNKNVENLRQFNYSSNKAENPVSIFSLKDKIYILFGSNSNTGIIERSESFKTCALMEINKVSLRCEKLMLISNNNDSFIKDVYIDKETEKAYFLIRFTGTEGTFYNTLNKSYYGHMVIEYDCKNIFVLRSILSLYDSDSMYLSKDGIYIVQKNSMAKYIDVKYIDYTDDNKSKTLSKIVTDTSSVVIGTFKNALIIIENDDMLIDKISIFLKEENEIKTLSYYNIAYHASIIKEYNDEIIILSNVENIDVYNLSIYKIEKSVKTINNNTFEEATLYKNYEEVECEKDNLATCNLQYGTYYYNRKIKSKSVSVIYKSNVHVNLNTNIRENKIYDIGTKVYANGNMALNGNSINNNYILENVGKYQLAITSVNGDNTYISFEVGDLSEREMVNDNKKEIKKCAYLNFEETKNYLAKAEYDVKLYENKENIKYALIFILIILTILSFYLMYKNKKKKGDLK